MSPLEKYIPPSGKSAWPVRFGRQQYVTLAQVFIIVLLLLALYEIGNHWFLPNITRWQSYLMTMIGGAAAATAVAGFVFRIRLRDVVAQLDHARQVEKSLRYSEAQYRAIIENQTELICRFSPDGTLTFVNETYCRYLEMSPAELLGRSVFSLIVPDRHEESRNHLAAVVRGKKALTSKDRLLSPSPKKIWIEWTDSPLFDDHGQLLGFQTVGHDITARIQVEQMLALQRDLAAVLNTNQPLSETLQEILAVVLRIEQLDAGGIYLIDSRTGDMDRVAYLGASQEFANSVRNFPSNSPQARLARTGQVLYTHAETQLPADSPGRREGFRALAIVPVLHEGKAVASMNLGSHVYDEIPAHVQQVLATLAEQMGSGIARLRAEAALRTSQKNLQTLFNTITDFLYIMDEQGHIIHVNPVVKQRLGYTFDELRSLPMLKGDPATRHDTVVQIVADILTGGHSSCPTQLQAKDGTIIPVDTKIVPGTWNDQPVLFGLSRDITELTQSQQQLQASLQEKEILLKEIHHRVKNNMQVIASMLYLQSKRVSDERVLDALQESRDRIKSMALIHEQLYRFGNLGVIDFQKYLTSLTTSLAQTYRTPGSSPIIHVQAGGIVFGVDTAIPLGLIVTELVSNALKHAFPHNQAGQIDVELTRPQPTDCLLTVRDRGVGFPPALLERVPVERLTVLAGHSLGMQLVDTLVAQLDGEITVYNNEGAVVEIKLPVVA